MADGCAYLSEIEDVKLAEKRECEECVLTGSRWLYCFPDEAFTEY